MYWFPKAFGFRLNERWGRISVACWVAGFYLAFMPLYVLGAAGVARRTQEIFDPAFRPWLLVALFGAFVLAAGLASLFVQLYVSIRDREANRVSRRRPVGRARPRMVRLRTAAGMELRDHPACGQSRRLLLAQAQRRRLQARRPLPRHRAAEESPPAA